MITFTIVLLLIAGTVEGFVSTSGAPVAVRLTITIMSALFLIVYLRHGARVAQRASTQGSPETD